jgi:predicted ABC-type transport system involved in lysophospholipase L1 biosynthesis ATPase subunit
MGPSGSGKSTLLQTAAGLDRPTSGRVWLGDTDLSRLSETKLTKLRRTRIGFVFQAFNLIGALTVEENEQCLKPVDGPWEAYLPKGSVSRESSRPARQRGSGRYARAHRSQPG